MTLEARKEGAGLFAYLKEAFFFHWNLLFMSGAVAAAALSPVPDMLLPLVGAAEMLYLTGLVSSPRFRAAIDAKARYGKAGTRSTGTATSPSRDPQNLIENLSEPARERFARLRQRCLDMRDIAHGVGGRTMTSQNRADDMRNSGLDRLLWVFLRLLVSRQALERFQAETDETRLSAQVEQIRSRLEASEKAGDERLVRSLRDSLATAELRLDNYRKAGKNLEFVTVELDRIEGKIQAISEMSINRQDPDFISREVDSVTESMQHTEAAISELHVITGLMEDLAEPPAILEAET